ncbi:MAG: carbohydrate ABC transporter permease [Paenibacillaceae bacterium]|nr:carbohydrate ABC transporter permease [Paenibacillaceae bacterium]
MIISRQEKWFQYANYALLLVIGLGALFPFLYIVSVSLTPTSVVDRYGGFLIFPRQITFAAYEQVFTNSAIPRSLLNSLFITGVGTLLSLLVTAVMGFGLAKQGVPGRSVYLFLVVFTILFSGGIIPTYLVVKDVGLLNSLWSLIIPTLINPFNLLIFKTFFQQLPKELEDAAVIDGSGELGIFVRITLPLSVAVLLTIGLFYAVFYWNVYFHAILYLTDAERYPLQVALRQLLMQPDPTVLDMSSDYEVPAETMKMAGVVVSTLPIVLAYPFVQKYFMKGATLGAVKG